LILSFISTSYIGTGASHRDWHTAIPEAVVILIMVLFVVLVAILAVGAIMVVAMLITPAAAAYLWTDRLLIMFGLSGSFGVLSALMGYYIAAWLDTSISGTMAFATGIVFMISFLCSPKHGILVKYIRPSISS
jgi:manganese/zinc/iron transport system permease protein